MRTDGVYAKTLAGQAEVQARRAGLSARQRTLLIMLDGRKPLSAMLPLLPVEELSSALDALLGLGFVVEALGMANMAPPSVAVAAAPPAAPVSPAASATPTAFVSSAASAPPAAPASHAVPVSTEAISPPAAAAAAAAAAARPNPRLAEAKSLMRQSAEKYLGLLASDLVRRIEQASDEAQVQSAIGLWHMAMRDSKYGREVAGPLLEQTRGLMQA